MNKSVPTLLGIVIILLVVLLVVVFYNYKLTEKLGAGGTVVGTVGGEALTGVEAPKSEIGVGEVMSHQTPESQAAPSPMVQDTRAGRIAREAGGPKEGMTPEQRKEQMKAAEQENPKPAPK